GANSSSSCVVLNHHADVSGSDGLDDGDLDDDDEANNDVEEEEADCQAAVDRQQFEYDADEHESDGELSRLGSLQMNLEAPPVEDAANIDEPFCCSLRQLRPLLHLQRSSRPHQRVTVQFIRLQQPQPPQPSIKLTLSLGDFRRNWRRRPVLPAEEAGEILFRAAYERGCTLASGRTPARSAGVNGTSGLRIRNGTMRRRSSHDFMNYMDEEELPTTTSPHFLALTTSDVTLAQRVDPLVLLDGAPELLGQPFYATRQQQQQQRSHSSAIRVGAVSSGGPPVLNRPPHLRSRLWLACPSTLASAAACDGAAGLDCLKSPTAAAGGGRDGRRGRFRRRLQAVPKAGILDFRASTSGAQANRLSARAPGGFSWVTVLVAMRCDDGSSARVAAGDLPKGFDPPPPPAAASSQGDRPLAEGPAGWQSFGHRLLA
uniref:Tau95_N domain-containing protein n=1 Tax=Macrostomum lignano TaxID=282301 RepID=A0A1I8FPT4_9PLAT